MMKQDSARSRLLKAATALFREKGYERTTVRDLARAVGIQSGSIFHHFPNKEAILFTLMKENININLLRMQNAINETQSPKEKLRNLIHCELLSIHGETGSGMAVLFFEWRSLNKADQEKILALRADYEALWLNVLNQCQTSYQLTIESQLLRKLLTGSIAWSINWYKTDGPLHLDKLADTILQLAIPQHH